MVSKNEITGDKIQSKINNNSFRDNFDKIFKTTTKLIQEQQEKEKEEKKLKKKFNDAGY